MQVQAHPEPANFGRDWEQGRRLVALELLEDAGHLPAHQRTEQRPVLLRAGAGHQLLRQPFDVVRFGHAGQSITVAPFTLSGRPGQSAADLRGRYLRRRRVGSRQARPAWPAG